MYTVANESNTKCMLYSKLLVAHVPHPNNVVYFHQRVIVNTSFVAGVWMLAYFFWYSFDSATDSSGDAWLARENSTHTTFYNRIVLFKVSNSKLI
jgi:hypothetical protein